MKISKLSIRQGNHIFPVGSMSGWREDLYKELDEAEIPYFDPIVKNWNKKAKLVEDLAKEFAFAFVCVLTPPTIDMHGIRSSIYSVAEITKLSLKRPEHVFFMFKGEWEGHALKQKEALAAMWKEEGAKEIDDYSEFIKWCHQEMMF